MKKYNILITVILLLILLLSAINVSAETLDFSTLSDEELIDIQNNLNNEILKRGLKKAKLPSGLYEAGVDVPAGTYVVTAITQNERYYPLIRIYKDINSATALLGIPIFQEVLTHYGECKVTLEEGYVLKLENVTYSIERFNMLSL